MNVIGICAVALAALAVLLVSFSGPRKPNAHQLGEEAFQRIFGAMSPRPKLKTSWSYAFPAFEVIFESKAEKEGAALLNAKFSDELDELLKDYGSINRRFRAALGVSFTYPGYIEELVAAYRLKGPNQLPEPTSGLAPGRGSS